MAHNARHALAAMLRAGAGVDAAQRAAPFATWGAVAGSPPATYERKVTIFSPARGASQQGLAALGKWKIEFDYGSRWENPLMGWNSTADPLANVGYSHLTFDSRAAAERFAKEQGWSFVVAKDPNEHSRLKRHTRWLDYGSVYSTKRAGIPLDPAQYSDPSAGYRGCKGKFTAKGSYELAKEGMLVDGVAGKKK